MSSDTKVLTPSYPEIISQKEYSSQQTNKASETYGEPSWNELRKMYISALSPELPFEEAAKIYLSLLECNANPPAKYVAEYIRSTTLRDYRQYARTLSLFFDGTKLCDIDEPELCRYQDARAAGAPPFIRYRRPQDAKDRMVNGVLVPAVGKTSSPAHPAKIKQELNFLIRIMKRSGAWTKHHEEFFRHLIVPNNQLPRALTPNQQEVWLETARSRERWQRVYWYSLLAFDTIASPNELRLLRIGDINTVHHILSIEWASAKNKHRRREITVRTADARWALEQLMIRAKELGATSPIHYLFPYRNKRTNLYEPDKPMTETGLRPLWNEVREASDLKWFRIEDTRHTGATRDAERGVLARIIAERMGHSDERMQKHYQQLSEAAQNAWLENPREQFFRSQPGWQAPRELPPSMRPQAVHYGPGEWKLLRGRYRWSAS